MGMDACFATRSRDERGAYWYSFAYDRALSATRRRGPAARPDGPRQPPLVKRRAAFLAVTPDSA